jgi:hypothetical protein
MAKRPDSCQIAFWRYEQVEEALAPELNREGRALILKRKSRTPVCLPSGETRAISLPTLYRWLSLYRKGGLEALRPRPRRDLGKKRSRLPGEVVAEALRLLTEDPGLSFTLLLAVLGAMFEDVTIARSTLQRRLAAHPSYRRLRRAEKHSRRRTRFVARAPHDIWHCDAKGPVPVRLTSGEEILFHILSILDDATRAVLAAIIVLSPDLGAAVRVFRVAALRFGLPVRLYADRASIFDSKSFRMGLAGLGAHRIRTKPRNAEAHGKIEAYHRTLVLWFTGRLAHQQVVDLVHLQQLLDGAIGLYQGHYHRSIKTTPHQALADRVSPRQVPPTRLVEAFRQERKLKAHRKTGEVEIGQITYLVADELRGMRLTFLVDSAGEVEPLVVHPHSSVHLPLRRAMIKPQDLPAPAATVERRGAGPLQALYDSWCGKVRPQAEPGFGLPELYALLARLCNRHVPGSDAEAALVQRIYHRHGPWRREATEEALRAVEAELGSRRPVRTYLDALVRRVVSD